MYQYDFRTFSMNKEQLDEAIFSWEWQKALDLEWTEDELLTDASITATGVRRSEDNKAFGSNDCAHYWVNISFSGLHYACKYCGVDKSE